MKDLEFYKKELMKILRSQEEDSDFKKSLISFGGDLIIEKGRAANIGEIREWKGKKYIKVASGKWKPKYDTVSRGAKQSIAITKKRIQNAKTIEELAQILKENKDRFSDENGNPIEIAKEILTEAKNARKTISKIGNTEKTFTNESGNKARLEGNKIRRNGKTVDKKDPQYKTALKEAFTQEYKEDIKEYKESKQAKEEKPESKTLVEKFNKAIEKLEDDMIIFSDKIDEAISFVKKLFLQKKKKRLAEKKAKEKVNDILLNRYRTTTDYNEVKELKKILKKRGFLIKGSFENI